MIKIKQFNKVIITGGAGYVGSALVPYLLEKGYEVVVFDLFIYGDVFADIDSTKLIQVKADIRDKEKLIEASKGCDAMIHLACISNDPSFELQPDLGKSINFDAFPNVVEAVRKNSIKRLINASTSSVYGIKEEQNVVEAASLEPLTDYSKFKAMCEQYLKDNCDDIEWVTIRPATVCGYSARVRLDVVVNILTINALVNKKIKVFGGSQLRPNININDMIRAYEALLEAPSDKIKHDTFNAGYQNLSVVDIANTVKKVIGQDLEIEVVPTNDNRSYHINSDKIQKVLGFEPKFTVEQAIETIVEAFKSGKLKDPLTNPIYYNIKRMQEVKLQ